MTERIKKIVLELLKDKEVQAAITDEQTWNKEQIDAAVDALFELGREPCGGVERMEFKVRKDGKEKAAGGMNKAAMKKFLFEQITKPKPVFKVGEVVIMSSSNTADTPVFWNQQRVNNGNYRHLNETHSPALALAIERLENIHGNTTDGWVNTVIREALSDIRAMV